MFIIVLVLSLSYHFSQIIISSRYTTHSEAKTYKQKKTCIDNNGDYIPGICDLSTEYCGSFAWSEGVNYGEFICRPLPEGDYFSADKYCFSGPSTNDWKEPKPRQCYSDLNDLQGNIIHTKYKPYIDMYHEYSPPQGSHHGINDLTDIQYIHIPTGFGGFNAGIGDAYNSELGEGEYARRFSDDYINKNRKFLIFFYSIDNNNFKLAEYSGIDVVIDPHTEFFMSGTGDNITLRAVILTSQQVHNLFCSTNNFLLCNNFFTFVLDPSLNIDLTFEEFSKTYEEEFGYEPLFIDTNVSLAHLDIRFDFIESRNAQRLCEDFSKENPSLNTSKRQTFFVKTQVKSGKQCITCDFSNQVYYLNEPDYCKGIEVKTGSGNTFKR